MESGCKNCKDSRGGCGSPRFLLTPYTNYFVSIERYRGNLIIADLGYYCFERFKEIDNAEGFFLSRLKTNVKAFVVATSNPEEGNNVGKLLSKTKWKSDIVDMVCQFGKPEESITFRVFGMNKKISTTFTLPT